MLKDLKRIVTAMQEIVADSKAGPLARIEAARIASAALGVWVPTAGFDKDVPKAGKTELRLQVARHYVAQKLFETRAKQSIRNRRAYIRRRIAELEASGANPEMLAEFRKELQDRQPKSTTPTLTPEQQQQEQAELRAMGEWAKQFLEDSK